MTIGDVLDRSIQLYRSNFLKFVGIVLLVKGPYMLLGYVFAYISAKFAAVLFPDMPYAFGENLAFSLIRLLEILFVGPVLIAAMTMAMEISLLFITVKAKTLL